MTQNRSNKIYLCIDFFECKFEKVFGLEYL